jgi:broad specificity phosphatase PhoE
VSDRIRVWCLRHAQSESSAQAPGPGKDTRLTELGRSQAIAAAQMLAAEPIIGIYSSTALRARQTAEQLAAVRTAAPGMPDRLITITPLPELVEVYCTAEALRAWVVERDLGRRAADGEDSETGHQVVARVAAAFQKIAAAHPGETAAVVGHVASLTVALGRLCSLGCVVWGTPLPHARPFLVEWDGQAWHCPIWPAVG